MTKKALPFVSIIIVNYNGRHFLGECLTSLSQLDYPADSFEVILVDNNSKDDSIAYVSRQFPKVLLVPLKENTGFTGGNIAGYERAKGEYIVLLNNDTQVEKAWLKNLVQAAEPKSVGLATSKIFFDIPFIELVVRSKEVPHSEISNTTDFSPMGVIMEDILCSTEELTALVWYKSGFHTTSQGSIVSRWAKGEARILLPFESKKKVTYTLTFHGYPSSQATTLPVSVCLGNEVLFEDVLEPNEVKQYTVTLDFEKIANRLTWLVQNAGNVVFYDGHGRDRGSIVRFKPPREVSEFYEEDSEYYQAPKKLLSVCGAGCLIKRKVIEEVGFLDDYYFMYYEDLDLSLRAWRMGWDVAYAPTSVVYHKHRASTGKAESSFFINLVERNHIRFTVTHFPITTVLSELMTFTGRLFMTLLKANVFRFRDDLPRFQMWATRAEGRKKAAIYLLRQLPKIYANRRFWKVREQRNYQQMRHFLQ